MKPLFKLKLIAVFIVFSAIIWAIQPLQISFGGANTTVQGGHTSAVRNWMAQNKRPNDLVYLRVGGPNSTQYFKVYKDGCCYKYDSTTYEDYKDAGHRADFQNFPELFEQMFNYSFGLWNGRGFSIQGDIIIASNRFSATRIVKNVRTGRVYVDEIETETP